MIEMTCWYGLSSVAEMAWRHLPPNECLPVHWLLCKAPERRKLRLSVTRAWGVYGWDRRAVTLTFRPHLGVVDGHNQAGTLETRGAQSCLHLAEFCEVVANALKAWWPVP